MCFTNTGYFPSFVSEQGPSKNMPQLSLSAVHWLWSWNRGRPGQLLCFSVLHFFYPQFSEFNYQLSCHGSTRGHGSSVLENGLLWRGLSNEYPLVCKSPHLLLRPWKKGLFQCVPGKRQLRTVLGVQISLTCRCSVHVLSSGPGDLARCSRAPAVCLALFLLLCCPYTMLHWYGRRGSEPESQPSQKT